MWRQSIGATLREVGELVGESEVTLHRWELLKAMPDATKDVLWGQALRRLEFHANERIRSAKESHR